MEWRDHYLNVKILIVESMSNKSESWRLKSRNIANRGKWGYCFKPKDLMKILLGWIGGLRADFGQPPKGWNPFTQMHTKT